MVKSCWICKTSGNKLNKSYFRVPKILSHRNPEISNLSALRLEKWRDALLLPDDTTGIRICSDHFLSGNPGRLRDINDPDWIPTKNLKRETNIKVVTSAIEKHSVLNKCDKLENIQNTEEMSCRLCLKLFKKDLCINIFEAQNAKLIRMITTVLGHKIVVEDGISSYACSSCLTKIRICSNLLTFFRKKEKYLHESKSFTNRKTVQCVEINEKCRKRKIRKIKMVNDFITVDSREKKNDTLTLLENLDGSTNAFGISSMYDSEQIRSIIENNSVSSEEDLTQVRKLAEGKRRKYDFQSVTVRPIELKTLKCNNCFKKFKDLEGLKIHKNFCKLIYCQLCKPQAIFKDINEREEHKKKYHSHSLVCQICGKSYSQSYLVKHFKNHFEERQKCPFCSKTLKNVTILMDHIDNFHENRFSSICEICGGNFKNLKKHLVLCKKI